MVKILSFFVPPLPITTVLGRHFVVDNIIIVVYPLLLNYMFMKTTSLTESNIETKMSIPNSVFDIIFIIDDESIIWDSISGVNRKTILGGGRAIK